jgi:TonB family protein
MRSIPGMLVAAAMLASCSSGPAPKLPQPLVINGVSYPPLEGPSRRPLSVKNPCYPARADSEQKEGFVEFKFTIEPNGSLADVIAIQEVPANYGFLQCAAPVFPHFKFQPDIVNGVPVATSAVYRLVFRLAK